MTPDGAETVLYSFGSQPGDGAFPLAGLVLDKQGNLYGTTVYGGAHGGGTVFKLTPDGSETVLHSFGSQPGDGTLPFAGLVLDKQGNLYGTTGEGGTQNGGTVFEMTLDGAETVLYSFGSQPGDGTYPVAGLVLDKNGNLYGTTYAGGTHKAGTVFKLTPTGTETVLHSFGAAYLGPPDSYPDAGGVALDKQGNLYGTTTYGGAHGGGTVFKLTPDGAETVLYSFGSQPGDGTHPYAGLVLDKKGNLYGTTGAGGQYGFGGTVFKVTP